MNGVTVLADFPHALELEDGTTRLTLRVLEPGDTMALLRFFQRLPEEERHYFKENVASPGVVEEWTSRIDPERALPLVAVAGEEIVGDATLLRSRCPARRHVGELRIAVDPDFRERGLGWKLMAALLDIAARTGLKKVFLQSIAHREEDAIGAAEHMGFRVVAVLEGWARDQWGNYHDMVIQELDLKNRERWWRY